MSDFVIIHLYNGRLVFGQLVPTVGVFLKEETNYYAISAEVHYISIINVLELNLYPIASYRGQLTPEQRKAGGEVIEFKSIPKFGAPIIPILKLPVYQILLMEKSTLLVVNEYNKFINYIINENGNVPINQ